MMNSHLKRQSFVCQLRKQQRECWRKEIRKQHMNETYCKFTININQEQLKAIQRQCKNTNYSKKSVEQLLSLLTQTHPITVANDSTIKIFTNIVLMIEEAQFEERWHREAHKKISLILQKLLMEEINTQDDNEWTKEFYDLAVLKECFHFLIEGLCQCNSLMNLFQYVASIQNQQFFRFSCKQFLIMIEKIEESKAPIQIKQVLQSLIKFSQCQKCLDNDEKYHILSLVNMIMINYDLNWSDKSKVSLVVRNILHSDINSRLEYIVNETYLIQNLFGSLETKEPNKDEFNCTTTELVGIMFATETEIANQVYVKCKNIIQILRNQLPMCALPLNPLPHDKGLLHANHRITKLTLFALSNIVANGASYLSTYLNSDIFRCFLHLYELVPLHCREQIAFCFRNMVGVSQSDGLFVMLNSHFMNVLQLMLTETNNEQICMAAMQIIELVLKELGDLELEGKLHHIAMNRKRFQTLLVENGSKTLIQGYLLCLNEEMYDIAERIIENIRQEPNI